MVSVIVPVYNVEKYIRRCIESILNQTYTNFELILVDDGSSDNSGTICDEYANRDNRIIVIHKENGGVSTARNAGIDVARGKYIMFVDSDDFLAYNCLELLLAASRNFMVDLIIGGYNTINYKVLKNKTVFKENQLMDLHVRIEGFVDILTEAVINRRGQFYCTPWAKLYKTSIINDNKLRFIEGIKHSEDNIFNIDFYQFIDNVSLVKSCVYNYNCAVPGAATKKYHDDFGVFSIELLKRYANWFSGLGKDEWLKKYISLRESDVLKHYGDACNLFDAASKIEKNHNLFKKEFGNMIDYAYVDSMLGGNYIKYIINQKWLEFAVIWKLRNLKRNSKNMLKQIILKVW